MKQTIIVVLLLLSATTMAFGQSTLREVSDSSTQKKENFDSLGQKNGTPIHQLRIYEIPKENLQFFHLRFKDWSFLTFSNREQIKFDLF